jgi:hypothetical protein
MLKLDERPSYFELSQQTNLSPFPYTAVKKASRGMAPSPSFTEEKIDSLSADMLATTVEWDCEGVILVDEMPRGDKINSDYVKMLKELMKGFK